MMKTLTTVWLEADPIGEFQTTKKRMHVLTNVRRLKLRNFYAVTNGGNLLKRTVVARL